MNELVLGGCPSTPLAHYLKALGVLRLVSEQADPTARGAWREGTFVIRTALDREGLESFFLEKYAPTPLVTPWNGGSGFFSSGTGKKATAIPFVENSSSERLASYRDAVKEAKRILADLGIRETPSADKSVLMEACRGRLPDSAVMWLDACFVMSGESTKYPPILGTGGNDGNHEFVNGFMHRLSDVFESTGIPTVFSQGWLRGAIFGGPVTDLRAESVGQFQPGNAGGANAAPGYSAKSRVNPWDYVLLMEGSLLFSAAAVRRLGSSSSEGAKASFPFCVMSSAVGYPSADSSEEMGAETRGEIWVPMWTAFASLGEIQSLIGEGRVEVGRRRAKDGLDFARAVASLGVDRGISGFERYAFHKRNGKNHFATHLGTVRVRENPSVRLLDTLDGWLVRNRWKVVGERAPTAVASAFRRFEAAAFALCADTSGPREVTVAFLALGQLSTAIERSVDWALAQNVHPFPELAHDWIRLGSPLPVEARLALALSSVTDGRGHRATSIRTQLCPLSHDRGRWAYVPRGPEHALRPGDLVGTLIETFHRRILQTRARGEHAFADQGRRAASLGDIGAFINARTDDRVLMQWLRACMLLEPGPMDWVQDGPRRTPPLLYGLAKLCFAEGRVPLAPRVVRLAAAGRAAPAARAAGQRLRATGMPPLSEVVQASGQSSRRTAASLLFPISSSDLHELERRFLRAREVDANPLNHGATE